MIWQFVSVAFGGALGACARFALILLFPYVQGQWPLPAFLANISGCLGIGICYALLQSATLPQSIKPLFVAGFLGAFTTFSTFALEAWLMLAHNAHLLAAAYVVASVIVGVLAVSAGYSLANSITG